MKTLLQLVNRLNIEIRDKGINNALDLWSPFAQYAGDDWRIYYEESKNEFQHLVLYEDEHYKLILIYWNGNNKSNKHGHLPGGGLVRVLSGRIVETRFHPEDQEKVVGTFDYTPGDLTFIHDALAYHVVENREPTPAVSLHLYCYGINSDFGVAH